MIPKIIHYCWFGGGEMPTLVKECIESWQMFCPDYEIKRWDESNCDFSESEYVLQAVSAKKWAYAADYFRAKVLCETGGIYLDTDLKLFKNLDSFLGDGYFLGFEELDCLESYVLGCEKMHPFAVKVLDTFKNTSFIKEDGSYNYYTMPKRLTDAFIEFYSYDKFYNKMISLENIKVYPCEFFSPVDFLTKKCSLTKNTHSMHLYNGSWIEGKDKPKKQLSLKFKRNIKSIMYRVLGYRRTRKILNKGK